MADQDLPTTPEGETPTLDVGVDEPAAAAAPRRRRATKKAAAPVTTPEQAVVPTDAVDSAEAPAADAPAADAPAKKAARKPAKKVAKKAVKKTTTRATKAVSAPVAEVAPEAEAEVEPSAPARDLVLDEPAVGQAVLDPDAEVLLVGLAPAANGTNRTGRMFTGDASGDVLYAALHRTGFATLPTSVAAGDGQALTGIRIVAAVRCALRIVGLVVLVAVAWLAWRWFA